MTATNGSAMKAKGSTFERDCVAVFQGAGHRYAERAYGAGRPFDVGDIDGLPGFAVECKAHRSIDLAGFMDEAIAEAANAGPGVVPVVVAKRRGRSAADAYAVLRLADFAALAHEEVP